MNTTNAASLCLLASAAGLAQSAAAEIVAVPVAGRIEIFDIANPAAGSAEARRLDAKPSAIRNGRIMAVEGRLPRAFDGVWTLTDRVLVRTGDIATLQRAVADPTVRIEAVDSMPGWFTVEAGRIDLAVEIAGRLLTEPAVERVEMDVRTPIVTRGLPTDPFFGLQWHMNNTIFPGVDARMAGAWDAGYTGEGVTICIVESNGFQLDHPDLVANVNTSISPATAFASPHMTSVAGVAGATANNGIGVAGAAYDADLSQALVGATFQIAQAFGLFNNVNDIKNNSWGPSDNGDIDFMHAIVADALENAATGGRGGLGEVFVWAGGNGQGSSDRVDYDPYASSRYTIAVGAIGDDEIQADYSEPGASLLVCAYSNGGTLNITTTSSGGHYTFNFGGTSAASPLTAGIIALMLQARPDLTWRDVQHVLVETARQVHTNDEGWIVNGDGRLVNDAYGYGVVDALAAVTLAESWTNVEPEVTHSSGVVDVNQTIPDGSSVGLERTVFIDESVRIESVELVLNVQTDVIGDLDISIISPDGTRSILSRQRFTDFQDDLVDTLFTSVRHWGEHSEGTWTVRVADPQLPNQAVWEDFELRFNGVSLGAGPCAPVDFAEPFAVLDLVDISGFVVAYLSEDPAADLAPPFGEFNGADITEFILGFNQGCP